MFLYHNGATTSFHGSLEILVSHSPGAEHSTIGKVLCGNVANWQRRENNLGARFVAPVELLVEDVPVGIDDILVVFGSSFLIFMKKILQIFFEQKNDIIILIIFFEKIIIILINLC